MSNWYHSCYRKLFLDYHTQQNAPEVGQNFNAVEWAEKLQKAGVQTVSCITKCGYGWRYYRKGSVGYIHPHLPEGMDILEDTVRECHKRGIRVIAYYHTFGSEALYEKHPEWLIRRADGSDAGHNCCFLNNECLEKEMLPQIGEIVRNYDVDGIFLDGTYYSGGVCYCESCKKRFFDATGLELPRSVKDSSYKTYLRWVEKEYITVRRRCADTVRENSNALLSVNWGYTTRQAEIAPDGIGFMTQDISQSNQISTISMQARNWALTGKEFDVMNHMALKWWQEWNVKPVNSLIQECALLLANGGRTWIGYQMYPWFGVEDYLLETLGKTFNYVKRMEPLVENARVLPYIGVLHSESQHFSNPVSEFSTFIEESTIRGIHKALSYSGIPYNSVCDDDFIGNLKRFKAVIIAGKQHLSEKVIDSLEAYVREGGKLLLCGKAGLIDEGGSFSPDPRIEAMIGAKVEDSYPYSHGYISLRPCDSLSRKVARMPLLCTKPFLMVKPDHAETLADMRCVYLREDGEQLFSDFTTNSTFSPAGKPTGTAALTLNTYGKGKVVYCASDLFAGICGDSQWSLKNLVKNLLNDVLLENEAIRIDAPDYVEMSLMENDGSLDIHLVNLVRESPMVDFDGAVENIIGEDILPIHDIKLRVPMENAPLSVRLAMADTDIGFTYEDGLLCFTVPKLEIHECIRIYK